ncbi:hypothetical protein NBH00_06150 [Paraconexibacter antarcticus]|uniref:Uncharacterized protein n=1 Tax=Paraconexibacter antarcticus TaxID=2949664 RepID=A0ABY5DW84_9ACTN|nr:hypothetical protein [Paraconexibacter antarcticus]UTI65794.1 hypothetical protein NBH00_06150 [Paraconexibacter antarcticus]
MPLFAFVQLEFPWQIGPPEGRYVLRGHAGQPSHVLVVTVLGASERRGMLGRKPKAKVAEPGPEPTPVPTTRATLVRADPLADDAAAQAWMKTTDLAAEADEAVDILNGVLHAYRTAAMDAFVRDVSRGQALVVRAGVGEGEAVAHGRWTTAVELPPPGKNTIRGKREAILRPQERLAAILSGRDVALAAEELTLRARLDLDAGRTREAALQLRVALEAAIAELEPWAEGADLGARLEALRELRQSVASAANAALQGGLDDASAADVDFAVGRLEAALRVRTTLGLT